MSKIGLLAVAVSLVLLTPSPEAKPPAPGPRIVASTVTPNGSTFAAVDSEGRIFHFPVPGCSGESLQGVVPRGNMFPGPPPGAVVALMFSGNDLVATMENGDVWHVCAGTTQGVLSGNVFAAAGQ